MSRRRLGVAVLVAAALAALLLAAWRPWSRTHAPVAVERAEADPASATDPVLLRALGESLLEQARVSEALVALERSADLDPAAAPTRLLLARALESSGRSLDASVEAAIARALGAPASDRSEAAALHREGRAAAEAGERERAAALLERAARADPLDPDVARDQARVLLDLGQRAAGLEAAARAWRIRRNRPQGARELAMLYLAHGDVTESERLQRQAQEMELARSESRSP